MSRKLPKSYRRVEFRKALPIDDGERFGLGFTTEHGDKILLSLDVENVRYLIEALTERLRGGDHGADILTPSEFVN